MTEYVQIVVTLTVTRIITALIGLAFAYFGYRLFTLGVYTKAGELKAAWGERNLMLKQAAPGTFFTLFGTVVTAVALLSGGDIQRAHTLTTTTTENVGTGVPSQQTNRNQNDQVQAKNVDPKPPTQPKPGARKEIKQEDKLDVHLSHPPTMSCSADASSVPSGERVGITATAMSPDNLPLTYTWQATGGRLVGSGAFVEFDTAGLPVGRYTVTVRVQDSRGRASDCSTSVEVKAPPS